MKKTVWYGGDVFPVQDARWIARQYYYDLMEYAKLPTNQESFDKYFKTSFNMCDERVSDYSFITVEDDRNNLFETRRNFATIAEEQGFVNVISTEYMLREYMAVNPELFMADAKAIPYIAADCARTKRNTILSLCLLLCIDSVRQEVLQRQLLMLNIETDDPVGVIWKEICAIFGSGPELDDQGDPVLSVTGLDGRTANFEKRKTILFVCTGNTCRSPMCAALFNALFGKKHNLHAHSCGLCADGSPISPNAADALIRRGIRSEGDNNYLTHISKSVTDEMLRDAQTVVGMTNRHAMELMFRFPAYASKIHVLPHDISDPYGGDLSVYERCLCDIEAALAEAFPEKEKTNE